MHEIVVRFKQTSIPLKEIIWQFRKSKTALIGFIIALLLVCIAVLAPFIAPHDPLEGHLDKRLVPPNREYPLGTDELGRCILSRIIYGTRISLQVGVIVVTVATGIAVVLGAISGYFGGVIDEVIMRVVDIMLAFPDIILALVIAGVLGPSLFNVMLALALVHWTNYARLVRGCVLSVKEESFVEASRACGASSLYIVFHHILPNCAAPVIVMATLGMGHVILSAAALSFLGLGAQPPIPEWGAMLNNGRAYLMTAPHIVTFPGLAIMITVLAFNLLGDGLRDALDPRLRCKVKWHALY